MTDHPRIRGEHLMKYGLVIEAAGSSPHTRGAPLRPVPESLCRRIIPAYAGSTVRIQIGGFDFEDHPRIRGEHVMVTGCSLGAAGSSPHTRGARGRRRVGWSWSGIIPAYAGSTTSPLHTAEPDSDHPRIRGEHLSGEPAVWSETGSSPHTRGAHLLEKRGLIGGRIIPAYAGSTGRDGYNVRIVADHPRIRGEHRAR